MTKSWELTKRCAFHDVTIILPFYFYLRTIQQFIRPKTLKTGNGINHCTDYLSWIKGLYMFCLVLSAIKQFAKEVGAPDAIVSDMAREQVSQDV